VEAGRNPPAALAKTTPAARPAESQAMTPRPSGAVTIISQRVIEIWDSGDGHRRIEERAFWQKREE